MQTDHGPAAVDEQDLRNYMLGIGYLARTFAYLDIAVLIGRAHMGYSMKAAIFFAANGGTAIYVGREPTFRKDDSAATNASAIHMVLRGKTVVHNENCLDVVADAWADDRRGGQGASFIDHSHTVSSEMGTPLFDRDMRDGSLELYLVEHSKLDQGKCMREFRTRGYSRASDRGMDSRDLQRFGSPTFEAFNKKINKLDAVSYEPQAYTIGSVANTRMFKGPHYEVVERPSANVMGANLNSQLIHYLDGGNPLTTAGLGIPAFTVEGLKTKLSLLDWSSNVSPQIAGQGAFKTCNIHDGDIRINKSSYTMGYSVTATRNP